MRPTIQIHPNCEEQARSRPGIPPLPGGDLYVFVRSVNETGAATLTVHWNPLQSLIWLGVAIAKELRA